jgi:hypothetical protein
MRFFMCLINIYAAYLLYSIHLKSKKVPKNMKINRQKLANTKTHRTFAVAFKEMG